MADEESEAITLRYGGNSKKKKASETVEDRGVKPVLSAPMTEKQSLGRQFVRNFGGESASGAAQFVLFEVVLPSMKNLIFDVVSQGFQRLLYGNSVRGRGVSSSLAGRSGYSSMYRPGGQNGGINTAPIAPARIATPDEFSDLTSESRAELEMVLDQMQSLIDEYDNVSVADFKAMVGLTPEFTDNNRGWTSIAKASVRHSRDGYWLDLPKAKPFG